ncbi:MAG: EAL domain-containing protein [Desulfobacteraceae bacterium]|nr:EAL domain-containing protein [Desulfobacteraceae bacterium]
MSLNPKTSFLGNLLILLLFENRVLLLTSDITGNPTNFNIVASLLELCEKPDLKALAEGIADLEQLEKLTEMKCRFGQGFYFAPSQDKSVIEKLLSKTAG